MRIIGFDASRENASDDYKWVLTAFNAAPTGNTAEQVARNIKIMEKLLSVSQPDEAGEPFPLMDSAYVLNDGANEIALTENEHKHLEQQYKSGMGQFRPIIQMKHYRRCLALIHDARTVSASEATSRGIAGAPKAQLAEAKPVAAASSSEE